MEIISKFYPTLLWIVARCMSQLFYNVSSLAIWNHMKQLFITTEDPIVNNHLKGLLASGIQFSELPAIIHCQYQERVGYMANVQL